MFSQNSFCEGIFGLFAAEIVKTNKNNQRTSVQLLSAPVISQNTLIENKFC